MPDRTDGVDHVPGRQAIAFGDLGIAGLAAVERPALGQQLLTRGTMDRAIDPAAAEQRFIRGVDDGVHREGDDVGLDGAEGRGHGRRLQRILALERRLNYNVSASGERWILPRTLTVPLQNQKAVCARTGGKSMLRHRLGGY